MLILKFLSENKTEKVGCLAEHGLSIYIETEEMTLLFDLGQSDIFIHNAKVVEADLRKVEAVIISHGHLDHTNGLPRFCQINTQAPIYLQKDALGRRYQLEQGKPKGENIGIVWTKDELEEINSRLQLIDAPVYITENIAVSGTMKQDLDFAPTEKFVVLDEEGQCHEDTMSHEQILVIRQKEGLYVFSGCSHLGVMAALRQAEKLFPGVRVASLISGMHLYGTKDAVRTSIIEELLLYKLDFIMPLHCTGMEAICMLKTRLGARCIIAGAGDIVDLSN